MAGAAPYPPPPRPLAGGGGAAPLPKMTSPLASEVNRARILQVAARLSEQFQSTGPLDPTEFFQLCFALARGIDYAVSHGDVPPNTNDLPPVIKQAYSRRNDAFLQPAVMVLLISAKNACANGWFLSAESNELLAMAYEMSNAFCLANSMTSEERYPLQVVSNVMCRFYPRLKLSRLFASFEIKSGYEILVADIYIPRNITREERIYLFIAQTDNMETSNCIISPPQVNFMINGKGVDKRTNVSMDPGPQFPSDITKLLKYGMNLFQAVGSFYGNYIIAIAVMTLTNTFDSFVLQDYNKPAVPLVESDLDSEIIEGASRISLNCPISFKRIKTPVKGHLCKHHQCFDFQNFLEMNSRKPSWRCPHCNQSVSSIDLRIDRFMQKILEEAGDDISDIIISADGTWELLGDHLGNALHDKTLTDQYDGIPASETPEPVNNSSDVVDLTVEDYIGAGDVGSGRLEPSNFIVNHGGHSLGTEDRKPLQDRIIDVQTLCDGSNCGTTLGTFQVSSEPLSTQPLDMTSRNHNQMRCSPPNATMELPVPNSLLGPSSNALSSPNYGGFSCQNVLLAMPALDSQLQQSRMGSSINCESERPPIPRNVSRVPIAIQALPALGPYQKRARMREIDGGPLGSSRSSEGANSVSCVPSQTSLLRQVIGPSAQSQDSPNTTLDKLRVPGAQISNVFRHNQTFGQIPNSSPQLVALPARQISQSPDDALAGTLRTTQDNLLPAVGVSQTGSSKAAMVPQTSRVSPILGDQMRVGTTRPQVLHRSESFPEPPSEQNWRPTGRMRGSLTGSAYSAAIRHYSEQPLASPTTPTTSNPLSTRISIAAIGTSSASRQINSM